MSEVVEPKSAETKSLGEKLLSIPKPALYLALILATAVPLFFPVPLPNEPKDTAKALFAAINEIPDESTVIIQSDWTESTRGESRGQMDILLRMLMRKNVKFAICSAADPQAPEVFRNLVFKLNAERKELKLREYKKWDDWVELGFYPSAEALGQAIAADIRGAFAGKRDAPPGGDDRPVFESPVLKDIVKVDDLSMYLVVTGTKSIIIAIERFSDKVKMGGMVTGVMGPETANYFYSGQLKGLSAGLKGVYDMCSLEEVAHPGTTKLKREEQYILSLHVAIFLLIAAVIVGNVGVFLTRRSKP